MIIFGWGRQNRKDRGAVVPVTCPRCNNETMYRWVSTTTWFSLFFVPLIPYSNKHYIVCPICSNGLELTKAQAQHAAHMVQHTQGALARGQQDPEYANEVASFWSHLNGGAAPPAINTPPPPALPPQPPQQPGPPMPPMTPPSVN
jgi:hypothetical protein